MTDDIPNKSIIGQICECGKYTYFDIDKLIGKIIL